MWTGRDHGADRADLPGCQRVVQFPDLIKEPFIDLAAGIVKSGLDRPPFRIGGTGYYQQAASGLGTLARQRLPSPSAPGRGAL